MDAIKLLEQDHLDTKKAMEEIGWSSAPKKRELFMAFRRGVEVHDAIEKNILYPALRASAKTEHLAGWNEASHAAVDKALTHLEALGADDEKGWITEFNVVRGHLLKHVQDDETVLFAGIRKALDTAELEAIGHKMTTERERLLKSY